MYDKTIKSLRQCAKDSCAGCKNNLAQIGCRGLLQYEAADAIEELTGFVQEAERDRDEYRERLDKANDTIDKLQNALLLMVLQYCTTNDGLLYHSFMSAGENAFAVLGLKNGQRVDLLWDKVFNQKPPKEESR